MTRAAMLSAMAFAAGFGAGASASVPGTGAQGPRTPGVAVVVDAGAPGSGAAVVAAEAGARAAGVTYRAPRASYEQLSVTARLAAEGYTTIIGVGLEAGTAIAPLEDRLRLVPMAAGPGLAERVAAQAARARRPASG